MNNVLSVLDDALDFFLIYMYHKALYSNQTSSIKRFEEDIKERCIESKGDDVRGILVKDFKMKFNLISAREITSDHYGKSGTSFT